MPKLREEITKSLRWFGKRDPRRAAGDLDSTWVRPGMREGKDFGQYRILKHLGSGGMGDVYLALDTRLGRNVALKFLPAELTSNEDMLGRFQEEARTASALNHPNILTIYDIGEIEGDHFIASEYIEGITLREALNNKAIDLSRALHIATQVASALAEAHYAGIVHRDLKPGNIMLRNRDDYVKVIDFGLAKLVERPVEDGSRDSRTIPGAVLGTVHYMSPEQARGREVDPRSDLWSLGVILYEMVAQKRPFDGDTESHVIVAILDHPMPPVPPDMDVPPRLTAILDRALQKDASRRYQSAEEMLNDLRQVSSGGAAIGTSRPKPKRASGNRRTALVSTLAVAALALFLGLWWLIGGRDWFAAPDWFQIASTQRATFDGNVRLAALSSDGAYLAYITGNGPDEQLHTRRMPWGGENRVSITQNKCIGLTFSPDRQSLYYVLKSPQEEFGRLYRMKLPSGIPGLLLENIDSAVAFSPDGSQFAFTRRVEERSASSVSILVGSTREPTDARPIVTKHNVQIREQLAWSPRGDEIAAIIFPAQLDEPTKPAVYLFSLDGREKARIAATHVRNLRSPVWIDGGASLMASGLADGAEQRHLEQLYIRTRQFHELPSAIGFDSISTTRDGRTLAAVSREQRSSIWIADGNRLQEPERLVPETENIESLAWSADGSIVFPSARNGNVNLSRTAPGGGVHAVGSGEACVEREPASFSRAPVIVYSSNCATGGDDFNIWRLDLSTGRRTQITSGSNFDDQPDVSPDGQWIVYTSWPSNSPSVWKVRADGGIPLRVLSKQARRPFVSPDGKQIVCQIREITGPWHVAIVDFDSGEIVKELPQIPISSDSAPVRWSPDGSALDYIAAEGGSSNIWRQPLSGGMARQLTASGEDSLLDFAWNGDGTKVAYIRGRADSDVVIFRRASQK
jgi:eukaryotic-like serine/threonine-protein kinase